MHLSFGIECLGRETLARPETFIRERVEGGKLYMYRVRGIIQVLLAVSSQCTWTSDAMAKCTEK